jgi:hypothetical protein
MTNNANSCKIFVEFYSCLHYTKIKGSELMITIDDVIEGMEFQSEDSHYYYHVKSKSVVMLTEEEIRYAENEVDLDRLPEWQRESVLLANELIDNPDGAFIDLPNKEDIDEYRMMEGFIMTIDDEKASSVLWEAIEGRGAFRRFKDKVHQYDLQDAWYGYRDARYEEIAMEWCKTHHIEYRKK